MKRWWTGIAVVGLVMGIAVGATAREAIQSIQVAYKNIGIRVNGREVKSDSEAFVVVSEGRTYVPARALAEALGGRVKWDSDTNTIQVYTPYYVQWKTETDKITYLMPYWSASMELPPGSEWRSSSDPDMYLLVNSPVGVVGIQRFKTTATTDVDTILSGYAKELQSKVSAAFTTPKRVDLSGALAAADITGSYDSNGTTMAVKVRAIIGQNNIWILSAVYSQKMDAQYGPSVDKAFASFHFIN